LAAKFEAHNAPYTNAVTHLPLPQSLIQVYAYKLLPESALSLQEPNKAIFLRLPTPGRDLIGRRLLISKNHHNCLFNADIAPFRDADPGWQYRRYSVRGVDQSDIALICRICRTRGAPSSVWLQSLQANTNRAASSRPIVRSQHLLHLIGCRHHVFLPTSNICAATCMRDASSKAPPLTNFSMHRGALTRSDCCVPCHGLTGQRPRKLVPIEGQPPDALHLPRGCAFHPRCPFAIERCGRQAPVPTVVGDNHLSACWVDLHG
jgi:oligopeptide/dipeptide ABC transporter ATP-binding protein